MNYIIKNILVASFFVAILFGGLLFSGNAVHAADLSPFENPDLSIMGVVRHPSSGFINQEFTVDVKIRNIGVVEANLEGSHITLGFGTDLEKLKGCSVGCNREGDGANYYGYYDIGQQITTLAKNEEKTFTFSSTVFDGNLEALQAGTYYIYTAIDVNSAIVEAKEDNNMLTVSYDVVDQISPFENPDLIITKIVRNPHSTYMQQEFTADVYIKNIGGVEANVAGSHITLGFGTDLDKLKTCSVGCNRDGDANYYGYYDIGQQITTLASNEEKPFRFSETIFDGNLKAIDPGTHYLYAKVNVNSAVTESNENNNTYTDSYDVVDQISPFENPDLIITKIVRNPESNYIQQEFTADVYVKNIRMAIKDFDSAPSITFVFGTDQALVNDCGSVCYDTDGMYYGNYRISSQIPSLGQNETKIFRFSSDVFSGDLKAETAGTYYMRAEIDDNNRITESNENNNTYTDSYDVVNKRSPFEGVPVASRDTKIEEINTNARLLKNDNLETILLELKQLRSTIKEQANEIKYLRNLTTGLEQVTSAMRERINNFITYGVDDDTKNLGEGERAAVMHSYKSAFNKLPDTEEELSDAIKIANGRWPAERSEEAELKAKAQFKKIYLRDANMDNPNDNAAVTVMSYGLRQRAENRNLNSERNGIKIFSGIYKHTPSTTDEWNIMQAITYSGASR